VVTLSISAESVGVFSTYLVVEVISTHEMKVIRVYVEIVAPQNEFYYVMLDGKKLGDDNVGTIDLGNVYFGTPYRDCSFLIVNESNKRLDFMLHSDLDHREATELNFSMARVMLRLLNNVTVDPKSQARIYLHFLPALAPNTSIPQDQSILKSINICKCIVSLSTTLCCSLMLTSRSHSLTSTLSSISRSLLYLLFSLSRFIFQISIVD
jgi:hypothetical protein